MTVARTTTWKADPRTGVAHLYERGRSLCSQRVKEPVGNDYADRCCVECRQVQAVRWVSGESAFVKSARRQAVAARQ